MPVGLAEQTKLAGNLLENALEAAKKYAKANPGAVIEIYSSIRSGLYLLEIRNSTLPISGEVLDRLFKTPVTPGQGDGGSSWRHGIGAYVVAETVKKQNGYLDFTYQPPILSVKIKIPVVKE
ncbi:GHKL domain-containing protein [Thermicanus aegyptius]|uniref:GHKL domain-containing protein n=1 Tax=Thermicanus aegyptius TaxID=94009 RepID=UPI0003F74AC0|nr:GHKL domain-containing protein [Thermicanus aegyptius]